MRGMFHNVYMYRADGRTVRSATAFPSKAKAVASRMIPTKTRVCVGTVFMK